MVHRGTSENAVDEDLQFPREIPRRRLISGCETDASRLFSQIQCARNKFLIEAGRINRVGATMTTIIIHGTMNADARFGVGLCAQRKIEIRV